MNLLKTKNCMFEGRDQHKFAVLNKMTKYTPSSSSMLLFLGLRAIQVKQFQRVTMGFSLFNGVTTIIV